MSEASQAPVLTGQAAKPLATMLTMVTLLGLGFLFSFLVPALGTPVGEVRSSYIPFSDSAFAGREVYQVQGCGACHTQMVRSIVSDVGLGSVALSDSNQVAGFTRVGPDLAQVGGRIEDLDAVGQMIQGGSEDHPMYALSDADLRDLLAYLSESQR
jgi:cbb3-type cytochrome oxidase cytochrome c subunit